MFKYKDIYTRAFKNQGKTTDKGHPTIYVDFILFYIGDTHF